MDLIQDLFDKTQEWRQIISEFEMSAENILRNKKLYEYYSEVLKIAKQKIEGKKSK